MRYAFIARHERIWPIVDQCRVLEVAASGLRAWRKRQSGKPRAASGKRVTDLALLTLPRSLRVMRRWRASGQAIFFRRPSG